MIRNSIKCLKCKYWVCKRCSIIKRRLKSGINYESGKCKDCINDEDQLNKIANSVLRINRR